MPDFRPIASFCAMDAEFEWDSEKESVNRLKHGMSFGLARRVFLDPNRVTRRDDRHDYGEDRFITTGDIDGRLVVVVFTVRGEVIRIISARRANPRERRRHGRDPHEA